MSTVRALNESGELSVIVPTLVSLSTEKATRSQCEALAKPRIVDSFGALETADNATVQKPRGASLMIRLFILVDVSKYEIIL